LLSSHTNSIEEDDQRQGLGDNDIVKERIPTSGLLSEPRDDEEEEDNTTAGEVIPEKERLKRNKRILEKYKMMAELMAEIIPGIIENNRTEAYYRFLKKFKKLKRRRRRKQKKCKRKYTAVERWLSHQLAVTKKRAYKHRISEQCKQVNQKETKEGMYARS